MLITAGENQGIIKFWICQGGAVVKFNANSMPLLVGNYNLFYSRLLTTVNYSQVRRRMCYI